MVPAGGGRAGASLARRECRLSYQRIREIANVACVASGSRPHDQSHRRAVRLGLQPTPLWHQLYRATGPLRRLHRLRRHAVERTRADSATAAATTLSSVAA